MISNGAIRVFERMQYGALSGMFVNNHYRRGLIERINSNAFIELIRLRRRSQLLSRTTIIQSQSYRAVLTNTIVRVPSSTGVCLRRFYTSVNIFSHKSNTSCSMIVVRCSPFDAKQTCEKIITKWYKCVYRPIDANSVELCRFLTFSLNQIVKKTINSKSY